MKTPLLTINFYIFRWLQASFALRQSSPSAFPTCSSATWAFLVPAETTEQFWVSLTNAPQCKRPCSSTLMEQTGTESMVSRFKSSTVFPVTPKARNRLIMSRVPVQFFKSCYWAIHFLHSFFAVIDCALGIRSLQLKCELFRTFAQQNNSPAVSLLPRGIRLFTRSHCRKDPVQNFTFESHYNSMATVSTKYFQ